VIQTCFLIITKDTCLTMARDILQIMHIVGKCIGNGHMFVGPIIPMLRKFH